MLSLSKSQVSQLKSYGFIVIHYTNKITISSTFGKKGYSFNLVASGRNKYRIEPPKYQFKGVNSHFTFVDDEERMFRNKVLIIRIIQVLKNIDIWRQLENKSFFLPNESNSKLPDKIKNIYKELLNEE